MAKTRVTDAPAKNDVYVGMLGLTTLAMVLGIALLALDADDYEWSSQPKSGPTISLPKAESLRGSAPAGGQPAAGGAATPGL